MYKKHIIISYSLGLLAFLAISVAFVFGMQAQAQNQADAIAVRILPNPENYSIERWYREQGFVGSPQSLTVDGYEAIRDGRTVYVNAANITGTNPYTLYTNIYLISYNQNSAAQTADILGRIVSQWKFNNNLLGAWLKGDCSIGTLECADGQACLTGQSCSDEKKCVAKDVKCSTDSDCPTGIYCSSQKAKIIRDVKRIGRLSELEEALASYRQLKNSYPTLESGTFVRNKTVSVWPSWKDVFLPSLAINKEVKDPINSLGYCEGFEAATCWDKNNNRFYELTNDNDLRFPDDSHIIYYSSNENGSSYRLCTGIENNPAIIDTSSTDGKLAQFKCSQNILNSTSIGNTAPTVVDYYLEGTADEEFNGFIKVADPDNNPLSFEIEATGSNIWSGWSETKAPVIIKTNNVKQIKLYSPKAGPAGNYIFNLKINDGVITAVVDLTIQIKEPGIFIEAEDMDHVLRPGSVLKYSFVYEGKGDETVQFSETGSLPSGISFNSPVIMPISDSKYRVSLSAVKGDLSSLVDLSNLEAFSFENNTDLQYQINIDGVTKTININLLVEPPVLDFDCPVEARIGRPYACFIGNQQDSNGHAITYSMLPAVAGLTLSNGYQASTVSLNDSLQNNKSWWGNIIDRLSKLSHRIFSVGLGLYKEALAVVGPTLPDVPPAADPDKYYIYGKATEGPGEKNITITAINEYGTKSSKSFSLKINSYCGDGVKDIPNTEGKGGYYNDGYEDCDGTNGTAQEVPSNFSTETAYEPRQWPEYSAVDRQYACTSNPSYEYPIKTGNYCIFSSPLNGGGFKGDGLCQTQTLDGRALENCENAPEDCGGCASSAVTCDSDNVKDPGELCDGSDLGGKTCGDFNPSAIYPYNNLSLSCNADCQSFNINNCFYPNQSTTTPTFSCQSGWFDCDGNIINGCESQCCPNCSGKQCGPDGCGNANGCGTCSSPATCTTSGQCCTPNCSGRECGLDGCGGSCGTCNPNSVCKDGQCLEKNCGNDHCFPGQLCCTLSGQVDPFCYNHMLPGICATQ